MVARELPGDLSLGREKVKRANYQKDEVLKGTVKGSTGNTAAVGFRELL